MTAAGVELQDPLQRRGGARVAEGRLGQQPGADRLGADIGQLGRGGGRGVLDGLAQPLPQPEQHPGQLEVRLGRELGIAAGVLDRLPQQPLRGAQIVVVAAHERQAHEGPGARRTAPGRAQDLGEQPARPAAVARQERAGGGVRAPARDRGGAAGRRELDRSLVQLGRGRRRAARQRSAAGVVQGAGDRLVRTGRGEGEVQRVLLRLAGPLGDRGVQGAPGRRVRRGVCAGGEQRVREVDHAVADVDDLHILGGGERAGSGDGVHHRQGGLPHRRRHGETAAGRGREAAQTGADERLERHREPLAGPQVERSRLHRPPELEGEERVPARELVDVQELRARGDPAEPPVQEALDGAEAQRSEDEAVEAMAGRRPVEVERHRRLARGPLRDEQADRLVPQAPGGEAEHRRARGVEPLHVVDGDHERRLPGQHPHRGERGEGDGALVGLLGPLGDEEGDLQRTALRAGELLQHLRVGAEEIPERGVGEARLGLGGPRGDDRVAGRTGGIDRRLPEGGLADAGFARDEERPRARGCALQEPLHALELLVPSDELGLHGVEAEPTPDAAGDQGAERSATNSPLRTPLMAGRAGL